MEKRSYKFGELKAKLQESASEFKPVFGDGVESKEKEINRQANKDIQKAAADYDGGLSNETQKKKNCIGEGIHLEVIPYDCHESLKRLSHVCSATDQVDFLYSGQITNQSSRRADMV